MTGMRAKQGDSLPLMLRWTCQACGWTVTVAAPGFAGDGRDHFPDGGNPCGPITAQRDIEYLSPLPARDAVIAACDCRANDWVEGDNGAIRCQQCGGYTGEPGTSIRLRSSS